MDNEQVNTSATRTYGYDALEDALAAPFLRGHRPFESPQWFLWRMHWNPPMHPDNAHKARLWNAANRTNDPLTKAQYETLVPRTAEQREREIAVWSSWNSREKLYDAKILVLQAKLKEGANAFMRRKGIPEKLDMCEYEFLVHFLNKTQGASIKVPRKDDYQHPPCERKTRVGAVYGNWHITALASEKEETSHKTMYVVKCIHCGFVHERFGYSRLGHPCPSCMRKSVRKSDMVDYTFWQTPQGVIMCKDRPEGATAFARQTVKDVPAPWQPIEDEPATNSEETCQPQQSAQQEEPPKEDPFIKDLQIPGF